MTPDRGRPDVDRDGRRPARLEHGHRPDHHRDRAVEALPRRRHGCWSWSGSALLGTIDADTPLTVVGGYMLVAGLGIGATMQNLVLAVQNTADPSGPRRRQLGRRVLPLDGWLDRRLCARRGARAPGVGQRQGRRRGLAADGRLSPEQLASMEHSTGDIPDLSALPGPVQALYETAMGSATGHLFLIAVPFAIVAFLCVLFIKEVAAAHPRRSAEAAAPRRPASSRRPRDERGAEPAQRRAPPARAGGRRPHPAGPPGHRRAGPRRAPRAAAGVVPDARLRAPTRVRSGPRHCARPSTSTRARSAGRCSTCIDLGLVDRTPDPEDGRATLLCVSDGGPRRLGDVADHRRKLLAERLGDWSADELEAFGAMLRRYNDGALRRRCQLAVARSQTAVFGGSAVADWPAADDHLAARAA